MMERNKDLNPEFLREELNNQLDMIKNEDKKLQADKLIPLIN